MHTSFNAVVNYHEAIQWLKKHMLSCPSKQLLHIECPGCGFQRSCLAMLEGHVAQSLQLYPATVPLIGLFAFTALHLRFQFSFGAVVIKYSYIAIGSIILVFYIYKIINHKIFC